MKETEKRTQSKRVTLTSMTSSSIYSNDSFPNCIPRGWMNANVMAMRLPATLRVQSCLLIDGGMGDREGRSVVDSALVESMSFILSNASLSVVAKADPSSESERKGYLYFPSVLSAVDHRRKTMGEKPFDVVMMYVKSIDQSKELISVGGGLTSRSGVLLVSIPYIYSSIPHSLSNQEKSTKRMEMSIEGAMKVKELLEEGVRRVTKSDPSIHASFRVFRPSGLVDELGRVRGLILACEWD